VPGLDFIVKTGDVVTFNPTFGQATVVVVPGNITGSSKVNTEGSVACIQGDESSVSVPGVMYSTPQFSIPGAGTLTISALGSDQLGQKTTSSQKPFILKGSTFTAQFAVSMPAQQPTPSGTVPDPVPQYSGTGQFVTSNVRCKGT
jgi:Contractile injection system spike tip protein